MSITFFEIFSKNPRVIEQKLFAFQLHQLHGKCWCNCDFFKEKNVNYTLISKMSKCNYTKKFLVDFHMKLKNAFLGVLLTFFSNTHQLHFRFDTCY